MKENREMAWREIQGHTKDGDGSISQPSRVEIKHELCHSFTTRKLKFMPVVLILACFHLSRNQSKVEKVNSKFFLYNAIPFNAANSGHYYQTIINTTAETREV